MGAAADTLFDCHQAEIWTQCGQIPTAPHAPHPTPTPGEVRSLDFHIRPLDGKILVIHFSDFLLCFFPNALWASSLHRGPVSWIALGCLNCPYKEWQGGYWA